MAIRLVRQTINPHTIRQASVFTEWPSVWYARLLAPTLLVRPSVWYAILSGQIVLGLGVERAYHIAPC